MGTSERDMHELPPFPMARTCPFAPPPEYAAMRERAPLVRVAVPSGAPIWAVTRHAEAEQVLSGKRVSTDTSRPGFPQVMPRDRDQAQVDRFHEGMFIDMDPPEHGHYRRLLISEFSVRRVNAMRPEIQRIVDEHIDTMLAEGSPADLVASFGLPVPSLVICRLLGVPYEDHEFFQSCTRRMVQLTNDPADAYAAIMEIRGYLDELVTRAERGEINGLLGRLAAEHIPPGTLTHNALVGIAHLLLIAVHETTANMIPLGVLTLLLHPEQLTALRDDPSLVPGAVEELLRYLSIVDWVAFDRMATEDMELGGQQVKAGDGLYVLGASANRDERAFERPDEFDIRRPARHHVAFGFGVHQCLGQNLARAELEIAFATLLRRIPALRPAAELDKLPFKFDGAIFGLYEFPVEW